MSIWDGILDQPLQVTVPPKNTANVTVTQAQPNQTVTPPTDFVGPKKPVQVTTAPQNTVVKSSPQVQPKSAHSSAAPLAVTEKPADPTMQGGQKLTDLLQPGMQAQDTLWNRAGVQFDSRVVGVNGTEAPTPPTPAQEKANQLKQYFNTSTSDLIKQQYGDNAGTKVAGFIADLVDPIARDITDIHQTNQLAGMVARGEVDQSVFDAIPALQKSNLQIVGDVAQAVLTAYTPGIGAKVVAQSAGKEALTLGLKELAKQGLKEGAFQGAQFGVAQALSSGSTDPKELAKILAINTGGGAVLGAAASTAIPALTKVVQGINQMHNDFINELVSAGFSEERARQIATEGGFWGKFNPKAEAAKEKLNQLMTQKDELLIGKGASSNSARVKALDKSIAAAKKELQMATQGGYINLGADMSGAPEVPQPPKGPIVESQVINDFKPTIQSKESYLQTIKSWLNPKKYIDEKAAQSYTEWSRGTNTGRELGNAYSQLPEIKDIPTGKTGWQTILDYEAGKPTAYSENIKQVFDTMHNQATAAGLEVPKLENYVPQVYKNKPEEVVSAVAKYMRNQGVDAAEIQGYLNGKQLSGDTAQRLGLTPSFAKSRALPSYEVAMQYGIKPKYSTVQQLVGHYKESLEKAIVNNKLVTQLEADGFVSPRPFAGSKPVNLEFSPKGYYADPKIARMLNGVFTDGAGFGQKTASTLAGFSRTLQEWTLSGGVGNFNAFSMAQALKSGVTGLGDLSKAALQIGTGQFKQGAASAVGAAGEAKNLFSFLRANFTRPSIKFFAKNAAEIEQMAAHGIDLGNRVGQYKTIYKNYAASRTFKEFLGDSWHKVFNEKTFGNFMPQLAVNNYKTAKAQALLLGMDEVAAQKFGAETTKAIMGILENNGRSRTAEDVLSSVFFAPKFRESMINMLINSGKSVTTKVFDPTFAKNRSFLAGMAIAFAGYDAMNVQLNGHHMWQNEPGKEFDLKIPIGSGQFAYMGFMPTILTIPRNITSGAIALVKGDTKTAKQKFGSFGATPVKLISELWNNQDYFGRPIYKEDDSWKNKSQEIGKYLGVQYNHPFIGGVIQFLKNKEAGEITSKQNIIQTLSKALELPLKFNSQANIDEAEMYRAIEQHSKERQAAQEALKPKYEEVQKLVAEGKIDEATAITEAMSPGEYNTYKDLKAADTRGKTGEGKKRMLPVVKQVKQLLDAGKQDEAAAITENLSEEDYKYYKLAKRALYGE